MDLKQMARQLVEQGGTPKDVMALLHQQHSQMAFDREDAKEHPLTTFRLSDNEWAQLKAHLLDGEAVEDDELPLDDQKSLLTRFIEAVDGDNQEEVWRLWPHLFKSRYLRAGVARALPGGGVSRGLHGSAALDAARARAEAQKGTQA